MEGIVSRLLGMLRSERGQLPVVRERIILASLIQQSWKPFAQRAEAKQLQISTDIAAGDEIDTDPTLLRSIITSLLDNAVEYTPAGCKLQLQARVRDGRLAVQVSNTVQHLAQADLPNLFERFWRKDLARSSTEHSGLGLSLARAFAHALAYELTATFDGDSFLQLQISGPATANNVPIDSPSTVSSR
jgi:signal transduction histidine kinase